MARPHDAIEQLNAVERPLLIYPIGELDDDPEELIAFDGVLAVPRHPDGVGNRRARVTIDFFDLNRRPELIKDRFRAIRATFQALRLIETDPDPDVVDDAKATLIGLASDAAPQASCVRSYINTVRDDPSKAWKIYKAAQAYFDGSASVQGPV